MRKCPIEDVVTIAQNPVLASGYIEFDYNFVTKDYDTLYRVGGVKKSNGGDIMVHRWKYNQAANKYMRSNVHTIPKAIIPAIIAQLQEVSDKI